MTETSSQPPVPVVPPELPEATWNDWPMVDGGPQHQSSRDAMGQNQTARAWSFSFGAKNETGSLALSENVLVTVSRAGLIALNASTGVRLWSSTIGGSIVAQGKVIAETMNGLVALDLFTGKELWAYNGLADMQPRWNYGGWTAPAAHGNRVVFGTEADRVVSVNLSNGTELWRYVEPPPTSPFVTVSFDTPTVIHGGRVFLGSSHQNLTAFSEETGELLWTFPSIQGISAPAVAGNVLIAARLYSLFALDARNGSVLWKVGLGPPVRHIPVIAEDLAYVYAFDNRVYAIHVGNGTVAWKQMAGPRTGCAVSAFCERESPAPAYHQGILFVPGLDDVLYAFDARNGSVLATHPLPAAKHRTTPIVANGFVYLGLDTTLHAIPLREVLGRNGPP